LYEENQNVLIPTSESKVKQVMTYRKYIDHKPKSEFLPEIDPNRGTKTFYDLSQQLHDSKFDYDQLKLDQLVAHRPRRTDTIQTNLPKPRILNKSKHNVRPSRNSNLKQSNFTSSQRIKKKWRTNKEKSSKRGVVDSEHMRMAKLV